MERHESRAAFEDQQWCHLTLLLQAIGWPGSSCEVKADKMKVPLRKAAGKSATTTKRPDKLTQQGALLEKALLAAADALLDGAKQLDEWDQR